MTVKILFTLVMGCALVTLTMCKKDKPADEPSNIAIQNAFGSNIDLNNPANYEAQAIPAYIRKDNTRGNNINNIKATLGRVLFYDKNLSIDNTVACANCHHQAFAFSDTALASKGVQGGLTGRHSMRLINARFAGETKFFWDERATSLEDQTTSPIQDHAEMGFSGVGGRPDLNALLAKLQGIAYYNELFNFIYGDVNVTEARLQECLAQFIRSIQSFDSKYDEGRALVNNDNQPFPNFSNQENMGKNLFLAPPVFDANGSRTGGGLGCNGCHNAPEFDIDPNSRNNGITGKLNATGTDFTVTRAPSLRDITNPNGELNTSLMHTGVITSLQAAIGHYGTIVAGVNNTNLDPRLRPNGNAQQLNLTAPEVNAMIAFLKTLSGKNVYTDVKWSDPFL